DVLHIDEIGARDGDGGRGTDRDSVWIDFGYSGQLPPLPNQDQLAVQKLWRILRGAIRYAEYLQLRFFFAEGDLRVRVQHVFEVNEAMAGQTEARLWWERERKAARLGRITPEGDRVLKVAASSLVARITHEEDPAIICRIGVGFCGHRVD